MAYIIRMFNGLEISPYLRAGDNQDLGTGAALTSFLPLPGGGYYDNYRDLKSPQGIRPITKSGLFLGTQTELRQELQAWRAMLGVRGRLTVEFDDGILRWQWARLQDVSTPRPRENKGGWLQFALTWITAAQNWRGVVYGEEDWTWGDGTWLFGDGSAEMGVDAQSFTLSDADETVTVTHNGDIDAPNVTLRLEMTGSWEDVTIVNETTGQQLIVERAAPDSTPMLEINAGARSLYLVGAPQTINTIYRDRDSLEIDTSAAHGLASGTTIRIKGTGEYDGDYYPIGTVPPIEISAPIAPTRAAYGTIHTGTVRALTDAYDVTTLTDKARWLVLAPGDNVLRVTWSTFPTTATLTVEFVDHYA